jgi:hypothetical protein
MRDPAGPGGTFLMVVRAGDGRAPHPEERHSKMCAVLIAILIVGGGGHRDAFARLPPVPFLGQFEVTVDGIVNNAG